MRRFLVVITVFSLTAQALARVGESVKQIEARYGKPQRVLSEHGTYRNIGYGFRGFMVGVEFLDGISRREGFARPDLPKLSERDVQDILSLAAGPALTWTTLEGPRWKAILHPKPNERYWLRSDEKVIASLAGEGNFLMIGDRKFSMPAR